MAHSIQTMGSKVEIFSDLSLMALLFLLEQEVVSNPYAYPIVKPLVTGWKRELPNCGPGTIDLRLDNIGSSNESLLELIRLLDITSDKLKTFGEVVPAIIVNELCNVQGVIFGDIPVSIFKKMIDQFYNLLQNRDINLFV